MYLFHMKKYCKIIFLFQISGGGKAAHNSFH